jgi:hypothetical protein
MTGPIQLDDVRRLHLDPGDSLLIRVPSEMRPEQMAQVRDEIRHVFPTLRAMIVTPEIEVEIVPAATIAHGKRGGV